MSLVARGLGWLAKATGYTTTHTAMDEAFVRRFGNVSVTGKAVTDDTVMGIAAAWSCMRILAETIGSIPWAIFERDSKGNARQVDHPLTDVLVGSPNADMTSTEFREAEVLNLCGGGNAYAWIDRLGERVTSLYPIRSRNCEPMRKAGSNTRLDLTDGEVFYRINDRGRTEDHPRDKVWHVKGFGWDGLKGLSPIAAAREAMGGALISEEFGNRFFSQGAMPSGVVSIPNSLSDDQRKIARENLTQMVGGMGNAHKMALFEGGMKPEPWGDMPLEEMQFLVLRQFSVIEICRFYRIPPHMVADLSRATFSNIEHLSQEFVTFTLMPYLTRFEASCAKWLLKPAERARYFLRFNVEGLLRADSKGRSEFYASALQNGWMSRNEVRAKENLNEVEGLDEYTVQANMTLLDQIRKLLEAQKLKSDAAVGDINVHANLVLPADKPQ